MRARMTSGENHLRKVWLVSHCEVFKVQPTFQIDEMPFHICSSLRRAEEYIRSLSMSDYSWWYLAEFSIDDPDHDKFARSIRVYNHLGKQINKTPLNRAVKAFLKAWPKGRQASDRHVTV
jgi:hypothetical protein